MLRFEDWFWGTPADPTVGIHVLHEHYQMGIAEMEELVQFLNQRIAAEEQYSSKLADISRSKSRADGFGKDESLLGQIFGNAKQEMSNLGNCHKQVADQIGQIVRPIQRFLDDNKKLSVVRKEKIDATWKQLAAQRAELELLEQDYRNKCTIADAEQRKYEETRSDDDLPSMDVMVNLGPRSFTVEDFNTLLGNMQREIKTLDVKSLWGSSKNCFSDEDALAYLRTKLHIDEEGATTIMNQLVNEGFIRSLSRGARFGPGSSQSHHYQWKRLSIENEPLHRRTRRAAERADFEYRKSVQSTEQSRLFLETQMWEYMSSLQHIETRRIELLKDSLLALNNAEKTVIAGTRSVCDRSLVYLETLNPAKEIEILVETQRTGNVRVVPAVYRNFYGGRGMYKDPVFGVSLEEYAASRNRKVPLVVKKCIKAIEDNRQGAVERGEPHEIDLWLEPTSNIPALHTLRADLNSSKATLKYLRRVPATLIISALKLYLIELPTSVCSDEIYEPLKLLYLSKADDFGPMRVGSLRSLLATLVPVHYCTLRVLSAYWFKMVASLDPDDPRINDLAQHLGHYVLRPKHQTPVTLHDKHPARLVKDLLLHHPQIFSLSDTLNPPEPSSLIGDNHSFRSVHISDLEDSDEEEEDIDETASTRALYDASSRITRAGSSEGGSMRTGYSLTIVGESESERRDSVDGRLERGVGLVSSVVHGMMRRNSGDSWRSAVGSIFSGRMSGIAPAAVREEDDRTVRTARSSLSNESVIGLDLEGGGGGDSDDDLDIEMSADGIVRSRGSSGRGSTEDLAGAGGGGASGTVLSDTASVVSELQGLKLLEDESESEDIDVFSGRVELA